MEALLTDWALSLLDAGQKDVVEAIRGGMGRLSVAVDAQRAVAYRYTEPPGEAEAIYEWHDGSVASVRGAVYRTEELPVAMTALREGEVIALAVNDSKTRFRRLRRLMLEQGTQACILAPLREGTDLRWIFILEWRGEAPVLDETLVTHAKRAATVFWAGARRADELRGHAQAEAQLIERQKHETLGIMAGGIVHDFNNVLQVVLGLSEVLGRYVEPGVGQGLLTDIQHTVVHAAELTKRFLVFSRQEVRRRTNVRVVEALREATKLVRSAIPENRAIVTDLRGEDLRVFMPRSELDQAIFNLCSNASAAMPHGGTITIACGPVEGEDAKLEITVTDEGEGMSPETLRRACEPFFTTKAASAGTGLGLAMVKRAAEAHGGSLDITSEVGRGTRVRMVFPQSTQADVQEEVVDLNLARGTECVLVVEDEPMVRRVTASHLKRAGYTVLLAANGDEAIEIFREHRNDIALIVTDVIMPAMGGAELVDAIAHEGSAVPFLFTSGYDAGALSEEGLTRSGRDLLQKPYSANELLRRVRALIDARA